jgi:DNA-directed RNA polymerase subunit RPC12/RpoP
MIPPLVRRCPNCGHVGRTRRFAVDDDDGRRLVRCPDCGHRFEPIENPWLK